MSDGALSTLAIATLAGALRVSTPFLFVSLGECLTEKSGRINLGNEGVLVLGAMTAYAASYHTGSPWLGVLVAASCGGLLGGLHAGLCSLTRINDIAMGIAIMLAGTGLAFFFGKPYVQPSAPLLPPLPLGFWSDSPQIRSALDVSPLFFVGVLVGIFMTWAFQNTRSGMVVRIVGDSVRWDCASTSFGSPRRLLAAPLPASAAHFFRWFIRAAGMKVSLRAKGSSRSRSSSSHVGTRLPAPAPRCSLARQARSGHPCRALA